MSECMNGWLMPDKTKGPNSAEPSMFILSALLIDDSLSHLTFDCADRLRLRVTKLGDNLIMDHKKPRCSI